MFVIFVVSAAVILTGDLRSGTTRAAPRAVPGARRYIHAKDSPHKEHVQTASIAEQVFIISNS